MPQVDSVEGTSPKLLTYSEVIVGLKLQKKYQRIGWNGKGLYIQLTGSAPIKLLEKNEYVTHYLQPLVVIVDGDRVNSWVPSSSDQLAEDYVEVP